MILVPNPQLTTHNPPALLAGPGWNGHHGLKSHPSRSRRGASGGGASEGRASEGGSNGGVVLRVGRISYNSMNVGMMLECEGQSLT